MMIAVTVAVLLVVIIAVVYVFMIMPRVTDRADMDMVSTDYAHRGLWDTANPENSLAAAALAVKYGYGIELDVQLSGDGQIMVFHDTGLKRMCGVDKPLGGLTCRELKSYRLAGSTQTIPTLDEMLALVDGRVPLLIEIKGEGKEEKLCRRVAERLDTYNGAFAIQSFDPRILSWFKSYRPRFARGQLVMKFTKRTEKSLPVRLLLSGLMLNVLSRPDFISVRGDHVNSLAFRVCVSLFKCRGFVWTVRSDSGYKLCRRRGLFAIFEKIRP